jgi:hypothetical protein
MSTLDLYALLGAAVLGAAFLLGRFGEMLFIGLGIAVVVGSLVAAGSSDGPLSASVILVAGLGLLFFGLAIVRVMVHRSVSLRMLARCAGGGIDDGGIEDIGRRLADIERVGLASREAGVYRLSATGSVLAAIVGSLYRVSGERR